MKKAASGKPPNFDEWARNPPPRSTRCKTCNEYSKFLDDINKYVARTRKGTLRISLRRFHRIYLRPRGYTPCAGALSNHITDCLGGLDAEGEEN